MQKSVSLHAKHLQKSVFMERTILEDLNNWRLSPIRKPLIINGARQVGKTWALREFASRYYKKEAYIVCRRNDIVRRIFETDFDIHRIIKHLSALTSVDITPEDTLIILDEVQDLPEAIEALKYFYEQAPRYHIAVAGSLLGISLHAGVSYPVGKVDTIHLHPMSFVEFIKARGEEHLYHAVMTRDYSTTNMFHERLNDLLREYYYVGGMPEVVSRYIETGSLHEVRQLQKAILTGYDFDFSKHAPREQVPRIRMVWHSMPSQLFKENRKFIYGVMRNGARAKDFELAIQWLSDAGLVHKVARVNKLQLPLNLYEDTSAFKLFLLDVGLLGAMADTLPGQVMVTNDAFTEFKGGLTEQFILQQLKALGISPICYHSADDSRLEIDFVVQGTLRPIPIEVKASGNVRANSLSNLLRANPLMHALRFSMLAYKEQEQLTCLPLYALPDLNID